MTASTPINCVPIDILAYTESFVGEHQHFACVCKKFQQATEKYLTLYLFNDYHNSCILKKVNNMFSNQISPIHQITTPDLKKFYVKYVYHKVINWAITGGSELQSVMLETRQIFQSTTCVKRVEKVFAAVRQQYEDKILIRFFSRLADLEPFVCDFNYELGQKNLDGFSKAQEIRNFLSNPQNQPAFDAILELNFTDVSMPVIPPEIKYLRKLSKINAFGSMITKIPSEFFTLTDLKVLKLSANELKELSPEIAKLTQLRELVLNKNHLESLPPEIGNLNALERLNVEENNLQQLPDEIFNMGNLKKLYVEENELNLDDSLLEKFKKIAHVRFKNQKDPEYLAAKRRRFG